jgi:hypothetical protein
LKAEHPTQISDLPSGSGMMGLALTALLVHVLAGAVGYLSARLLAHGVETHHVVLGVIGQPAVEIFPRLDDLHAQVAEVVGLDRPLEWPGEAGHLHRVDVLNLEAVADDQQRRTEYPAGEVLGSGVFAAAVENVGSRGDRLHSPRRRDPLLQLIPGLFLLPGLGAGGL